jgi:hypothetical protein
LVPADSRTSEEHRCQEASARLIGMPDGRAPHRDSAR